MNETARSYKYVDRTWVKASHRFWEPECPILDDTSRAIDQSHRNLPVNEEIISPSRHWIPDQQGKLHLSIDLYVARNFPVMFSLILYSRIAFGIFDLSCQFSSELLDSLIVYLSEVPPVESKKIHGHRRGTFLSNFAVRRLRRICCLADDCKCRAA